jgi:hypothetical protein
MIERRVWCSSSRVSILLPSAAPSRNSCWLRGQLMRQRERSQNPRRLFLSGLSEGGRLFGGHVIKHARENRNISLVLDQRTEMIGVK